MKKMNGAKRDFIIDLAKDKYNTAAEYPWMALPEYAVFRHSDNKKWYAIIMYVDQSKLALSGEGKVDILELKCNPYDGAMMFGIEGILPAYHMNKDNWITVLLDGSVNKDVVENLLEISFNNTQKKSRKKACDLPRVWIVPANPKYYDIEKAFSKNQEILWKQSSNISFGDVVVDSC